jgi:hypothetical protein
MKVKTAYSQKKDIQDIIRDLKEQINPFESKLIQFFASSNIDTSRISGEMQAAFPNIPIIGCTTAGEIISGKMLDNSIVAMAFGSGIIKNLSIEILTDICTDHHAVDKAFTQFEKFTHCTMDKLDTGRFVGMVMIDGLSMQEEKINERIGDLTNVTFIGGSTGDDLKFEKTYLYANGKTYSNAAILTLIECNTEFDILKAQSLVTSGKTVTITKANEAKREIIELNGKPAAQEYARLLNIDKSNLSSAFVTNPLGLVLGEEIFVRSPQKVDGDKIIFYCSVKEGMELSLLKPTDIIEDSVKSLANKLKTFGDISAMINYNCILRTLEMKQTHKTEAYGALFSDIPTIGFSTYGESYIGHMNQTSVILIFK